MALVSLTPHQRSAVLRLLLICTPEHPVGSVAHWDQRTSANDARAALSIAMGAPPNDVDAVLGTWDGPTMTTAICRECHRELRVPLDHWDRFTYALCGDVGLPHRDFGPIGR